jgi:Xaa-Pro aminopeptidase
MTAMEIAWLDSYHAAVRTELMQFLDAANAAWLEAATAPLSSLK